MELLSHMVTLSLTLCEISRLFTPIVPFYIPYSLMALTRISSIVLIEVVKVDIHCLVPDLT